MSTLVLAVIVAASTLQINFVAAIGVLLNIFLNLILIPKYYGFGSAIASLITQVLTGVIQFLLCFFIFKLSIYSTFMKLLFYTLGLCCFGYVCSLYIPFNGIVIILYFLFSLTWLFITKLITPADFTLLMNNKIK